MMDIDIHATVRHKPAPDDVAKFLTDNGWVCTYSNLWNNYKSQVKGDVMWSEALSYEMFHRFSLGAYSSAG